MAIYDCNGNVLYDNAPSLAAPWASEMHRGYKSATVAENTLPAFERAFKNGADRIEFDTRLSSDGVYVCYHDATVTVGGVTYTIAEETAETLTSLVLSTDPVYGDCKIPKVEDVLKFCAYTGMMANLDCKAIDPTTIAQLVIDCGMDGRTMYANTTRDNAQAILAVDPNAGFLFGYSLASLETWANALTDYHTRQRSYAWATTISDEALEATRAKGFKYLLSEVNSTTLMSYNPDCIEFVATADCKALNEAYLASLDFGL